MTDLAELLERVKAATGPDREIDRDLTEALYSDISTRERRVLANDQFAWMHPEYGLVRCEPYTASVDAALALVERVLPRWEFNLSVEHPGDDGAAIWRAEIGDPLMGFDAEAPTPALALLAAALEALAYQQPAAAPADVGNSQLTRDA